MVYESRVGDVFVLGASSWRIEDITADQVLVSPAPGQPGKLPFWHGDTIGRPAELGQAIGAYCRELGAAGPDRKSTRLNSSHSQISYAVFCLKKKKPLHNTRQKPH